MDKGLFTVYLLKTRNKKTIVNLYVKYNCMNDSTVFLTVLFSVHSENHEWIGKFASFFYRFLTVNTQEMQNRRNDFGRSNDNNMHHNMKLMFIKFCLTLSENWITSKA